MNRFSSFSFRHFNLSIDSPLFFFKQISDVRIFFSLSFANSSKNNKTVEEMKLRSLAEQKQVFISNINTIKKTEEKETFIYNTFKSYLIRTERGVGKSIVVFFSHVFQQTGVRLNKCFFRLIVMYNAPMFFP